MGVFNSPAFDAHERIIHHCEPESGLRVIIAVHSTLTGPAFGGCRMRVYASEQDAVDDALRLSRAMTCKCVLAEVPFGGGKAVILGDPARAKSERLLCAMGRFIDSLGGLYHTAEDVGTNVSDMEVMRRETRYAHGMSDSSGDAPPATAYGVFCGIKAAVRHGLGRDGLFGLTVAVQGVGNVGRRLCGYLKQAGARLVVADTDDAALRRVVEAFGARVIAPGEIHRVRADVFAPCALGGVLNARSIPELAVSIVAGAANNQLATPEDGERLHGRGILYAPDYVVNAGGVIDVAHEGPDYDQRRVLHDVARIGRRLTTIFRRAEAEGRSPALVAEHMVQERLREARARVAAA